MRCASPRRFALLVVSSFLAVTAAGALSGELASLSAEDWNLWRGPRGDGTSAETGVPRTWNGKTGDGVAWKVEIPGKGHGSPIVHRDRVYLATCDEESQKRMLLSFHAKDGAPRWSRVVVEGPLETLHNLNSRASSTPAADELGVYIAFLAVDGHTVPAPNVGDPRPITPGKILVAAYDHGGELRWKKTAGSFVSAHGFCSNPVFFEELVVINGDHDGDAYIVALERESGKERWRIPRENKTRSYVTPIFREISGRWQMILSGSLCVASYDARTGEPIWTFDGPTEQFVASPVYDGKYVFITGGYPEHHIVAIRPDGRGNITDTHVAWRTTRGAAYVPSPVLCGDYFLIVSDSGIASCFDAATGERLWMERLPGDHSSSLLTAEDMVFFTSKEGVTTVVRPGRTFDVIARNELGERCVSSPALCGGRLYLRGEHHLFAIEGAEPGAEDGAAPTGGR